MLVNTTIAPVVAVCAEEWRMDDDVGATDYHVADVRAARHHPCAL